jgi:hypothetical protein
MEMHNAEKKSPYVLEEFNTGVLDQVLQKFIAYHDDGRYDIRSSVRLFEVAYLRWLLSQEKIYPAILNEIRTFKSLEQGKLISFVLYALQLPSDKVNIDRVIYAMQELARLGKIVYGDNGWMIAQETINQDDERHENRTKSGTIKKVDDPNKQAV